MCAYALRFLLIHLTYLSAYSVIGLRLASRVTHDSLARDGRGARKISRERVSCWVPARFGVLETIVSAHPGKRDGIHDVHFNRFTKALTLK